MAVAFNDNIKILAPKPLDQRYLNISNVPYISILEVNSTILVSERYIGLTVNILNIEYWYETGTGDGDLVVKLTPDIYVSGGTLNGSNLVLNRSQGQPDIEVELSGLTSGLTGNDGVVSGATYIGDTLSLHRTEGLPDVTVTIGASGVTDGVVSGATLIGATLNLERTIGLSNVTVDLSPLSATTDIYVSGGTLDGGAQLILNRTEGQPDVTVDLSALSGGTGGGNDEYTGSTPSTVTVGGLNSGAILTGRSYTEIFQEMLVVYLNPVFGGAPSVTPQNYTVEVGTTLIGARTFGWSTTNSGNVQPNSIVIRDVTGAVDLATGLVNDGSESATITTIQLASNNAIQQWRTEGVNTNLVGFNSANRTVTAKFYRFYGANALTPTNSAQVRTLPASAFQTANGNTFNLATGSALTKFVVALPPSRTISSVIDLDALNADITASYVSQGTISVLDDGGVGTSQTYNLYEMNLGAPYAASHNHQIITV